MCITSPPTDPSPTASAAATRVCSRCARDLPLDRYGPKPKLGRRYLDTQCRECRNATYRARRRKRRSAELRRLAEQLAAEKDILTVGRIAAAMIARFRGLDNLSREWCAEIRAAQQRRPGSKTVLDAFAAIARMMQVGEAARPPVASLADLSDAGLEELLGEGLRQLVDRRPDLVLGAAAELGWTVTPPDGSTGAAVGQRNEPAWEGL